jgi:hypothetical protein
MANMKKYDFFYFTFIIYISVYVSVICGIADASEKAQSFLNIESILEGWESNYLGIKTMQISYTEQLLGDKPPTTGPNFHNNLVKYEHVERIEDGKKYHIRCSVAENGFEEPVNIMEHAFDGEVTTEYWGKDNFGTIDLGLTGRNVETKNIIPKYMLFETVHSQRFSEEFPQGMPLLSCVLKTAMSKSTSTMSPNLELISGQSCHHLIIEDKIEEDVFKTEIWIAHENGFLPMKYKSYKNNILLREIGVEEIDSTKTETGNLWYPKKAYRSWYGRNNEELKYEITTHEFVPNVIVDKNTFKVDFPDGTKIIDHILGIYYTKGVGDIDKAPMVRELKPSGDEQTKSVSETEDSNNLSLDEEVPTKVDDVAQDKEKENNQSKIVANSNNERPMITRNIVIVTTIIIASGLFLLFCYKRLRK